MKDIKAEIEDLNERVAQLQKMAKSSEKTASVRDVLSAMQKFISNQPIYLIVNIHSDHGLQDFLVSGSTQRIANYVSQDHVLEWEIMDLTSDRNQARKQAPEV